MICVYGQDCTDFSNNGIGPVSPQFCTVTETLNGEWELSLVHPLDDEGKWRRLVEGYILRAPVPAAMTPQVKLVPLVSGKEIYKITTNRDPLLLRSGTGTKYKILGKYKKGTEVIVLNKTTTAWYEVSCPDGKHGYMASQYLTYVRTEATPGQALSAVIEPRQLRDQPFRIYRVVPELTKITVYARHVFYDLMDNMIKKYEPSSSEMGAAVAHNISSSCLSEHDFTFYSDLTTTADEVSFININPVDAILGEGGLVEIYGAELARDWFDVFLVNRVGSDTDVQIREKKNLLGISYDIDLTDVVTRIMPTGEDADGGVLYLPELYIDSPNIGSYSQPKWIHLPVSETKEVTKGNSKKTLTQCYAELRNAAQAEFEAGCNSPTVTLKVEFINCADTEEYAQYQFLQNMFLGDSVRVIARRIGVEVSMRMTQYTYDCLTRKYTAVSLGTVADTIEGNTISSRQLASGIITGSKLAIHSVGTGQLQSGSVGSLQIQMAAIQTAHIEAAAIVNALIADAAITRAKIEEATIGELNAEAISAISARIQELAAGNVSTDSLYAALATIATAQITQANIDKANISWADIGGLATHIASIAVAQINTATISQATIDWANIAALNTQIAHIALAQITTASIQNAHIDWANIADLSVAIARIAAAQINTAHLQEAQIDWAGIAELNVAIAQVINARINTVEIDFAQIKDLVAGTAIITQGAGGDLYINRLKVTEANMVSLTTGELIIKGENGAFYRLTVGENGQVSLVKVMVEGEHIANGTIAGQNLIEGAISAREMNAAQIFADEAIMVELFAGMGRFGELFAASAVMPYIQASVIESEALAIKVREAAADRLVTQASEPINPVADMLWLDISTDPPLLKWWNGEEWQITNDESATTQLVTTHEASITALKEQISLAVTESRYLTGLSGKADAETVSTIKSNFMQTAGQIDLRLTQTENEIETLLTGVHVTQDGVIIRQPNRTDNAMQLAADKVTICAPGREALVISLEESYMPTLRLSKLMRGKLVTTVTGAGDTQRIVDQYMP